MPLSSVVMRMSEERPKKITEGLYDFTNMEHGIYRVEITHKAHLIVLEKEPMYPQKKIQ
jgi:hypothetical protein